MAHPDHPDVSFLTHILQWPLRYRTPDDLRQLFGASRFGGLIEVATDTTTRQLFGIARTRS